MKFGVCGGLEIAVVAGAVGYDFMESTVNNVLVPDKSQEEFEAKLQGFKHAGIGYPVLNCFVPGSLKITGPTADPEALEAFVTITMARAEEAGVDTIVFGSGGARQIPEGFARAEAHEQLITFCRMVGPIARRHNVTVVVEPLCYDACNVLNTVKECARLVNDVGHPSIRLLVDSYHMMLNGDAFENIIPYGDLLAHVHVATIPTRLVPGGEECGLDGFFSALLEVGYSGRVSIEAKVENPGTELPIGLAAMRKLAHLRPACV